MSIARFRHIQLRTSSVGQMQKFYAEVLELPVETSANPQAFTVTFGESDIEFIGAEKDSPFYHFAVNVPESMFESAKHWLAGRTKLLLNSLNGTDQVFFSHWNAHAVYFADPADNIVELIARHTLPVQREGAFGPDKMLHVSEIGLASHDPDDLANRLIEQFGLSPYGDSSFFLGDEYGLFVLPRVGRPWIPERRQTAEIYPVEVSLRTLGQKFEHATLPFVIKASD